MDKIEFQVKTDRVIKTLPENERKAYKQKRREEWEKIQNARKEEEKERREEAKQLRKWCSYVWRNTKFSRGHEHEMLHSYEMKAVRLFIFGVCRGFGCFDTDSLTHEERVFLKKELLLLEEAEDFLPNE